MIDVETNSISALRFDASTVTFTEERLDDFLVDAQPLLEQHWEEIAAHHDIPLDVDLHVYRTAEAAGRLCIIAARLENKLVGYAVFFVSQHYHYRGSKQAQEDIIYLHPGLRGHGVGTDLLNFSETTLAAKGCQIIHHHVKIEHPALGELLSKHGYSPVETIYSRRLD